LENTAQSIRSFQTSSWRPALKAIDAAPAVAVAHDVAARLRDRERVDAAAAAAAQQTAFPEFAYWQPCGIAQGYAGLAVMCSCLAACFPDDGWDVAGHEYLTCAAKGAEGQPYLSTGLFGGLSGLAFAAWSLSRGGTRYRKLLAATEEFLLPQVVALADNLQRQKHGVSVAQFDVISGLAGVGAYLLCRRGEPGPAAALRAVLRSLIVLSAEEQGIPCWHTPAHLMADEPMRRHYPAGNLNCGLAHGIPGPLALLALAQSAGVMIEGQAEAIDRLAGWLAQQRMDDRWGVNWPIAVPLGPAPAPVGPSRAAWCYGSPGVARALWLAGEALDRCEYRDLAIAAMKAVYQRPLFERAIDSPTFCHGIAGLLQITLRFAHDTGLAQFTVAADILGQQLLSLYDPTSRLGYYSLEPGGLRVDQPGLLDGAPGVVLVLLAAATDVEPFWDRLFLLM
jgi:hypothetical protein